MSALQSHWSKTFHVRVDGYFLPLSIRQNRVEDVFVDFLCRLAEGSAGASAADRLVPTAAEGRFGALWQAVESAGADLALPDDEARRDLVKRWLRSELVTDVRATGGWSRRPDSAVHSIEPLHLAVAERFGRPESNVPAYGQLVSSLLSAARPEGEEGSLLLRLWRFFAQSELDPLASALEVALSRDQARVEPPAGSLVPEPMVWCSEHASRFQRDVENVLAIRGVSRRTRLTWLYSLFAFHTATYLLRMATQAERFARSLASVLTGESKGLMQYGCCPAGSVGRCSADFDIRLGERDRDHSRLLKRLPYYTSQLAILQSLLIPPSETGAAPPRVMTLLADEIGRFALTDIGALNALLSDLAESYPTADDDRRTERANWPYRLKNDEKARVVGLLREGSVTPLEAVARHLNFDDMSRSSNNVREWQFYQALARDPQYGFGSGRGDEIHYSLGTGLLSALVHSHCAYAYDEASLRTFERWLNDRHLQIDDNYRPELLEALRDLGVVEDVSDAGDAKRLVIQYEVGRG